MPRPNPNSPKIGQEELFTAPVVSNRGVELSGRHSEAMEIAINAARERRQLDDVDEGLATVLRAGATALDMLESQNKPYGPSKLIDPLVNALREARLTPESRGGKTDEDIQKIIEEFEGIDDVCSP